MRAVRSACASCAPTSTSSRATGTSGADQLRRIGFLGGTFNPPHVGHLICGQEACHALDLDVVLLVPAGVPPHKEVAADPGAEERARLCELAVAGDPRFEVCRIELERQGPSYTVDTLEALHAEHPDDELYLIVGGDMAHSLPTWRSPRRLVELATIAVAERVGTHRADIEDRLAGLGARVAFFDMPRIDLSSSLIRAHAAKGRPVRYLVPDAVADRVHSAGLYTA